MVSTYFKNLVADLVWQTGANTTLPDTYYLALSATEPLEDGTGVTEPDAATGYTRPALTGLSTAVDGVVTTNSLLSWPQLTSAAETANYWALFDAPSGGHLLMGNAFSDPIHLDANTTVSIKPNELELRVLGA